MPGCLDLLYAQDLTFPAVGTNPFTRPGGRPHTAPCRYCNLAPTDAQFLHRLMPVAVLLTNMASSVAASLGWTVYRVYRMIKAPPIPRTEPADGSQLSVLTG